MALTLTVWKQMVVGNLFKDDSHIDKCVIADDYVQQGKIVVIPQAGGKSNVEKNRATLPATVTKRTDSDIVYVIDEYTTDPKRIDHAEKYELSYDKMLNIMEEDLLTLRETMSDNLIYEWLREFTYTGAGTAAAAATIATSGADLATHLTSTTGNRKKFTYQDLKKAQKLLNKQNIPKSDRFALISTEMFDQLMDDADLIKRDYARELDLKNGSIDRLFGFQLMERSDVISYATAGTVKAPGAAAVATDNDAVVCWQKNQVERAWGATEVFSNAGEAVYYGDIVSMLARFGGRKRRLNGSGIVSIVQAAGS